MCFKECIEVWERVILREKRIFMKNTLKDENYIEAATVLDLEPAVVKAVIDVETGGRGSFAAPGKPIILFEGHVFWQRLKLYGMTPMDYMRGNEEILHQEWTRRYYRGGLKEYDRLERAVKIHRTAALESTSWGLFQIMGFNYGKCGCGDVLEFVDRMSESAKEQLLLWVRFMQQEGLDECLRRHKWALFALRYNGRGYKANRYDKLIEKAYIRYKSSNM